MPRRRLTQTLTNPSTLPELDVSPLIDVSFLLLIFFLVTSTLKKAEADLPTDLGGTPAVDSIEPLMVDIGASVNGEVTFNDILIETDPDRRRLNALITELERSKALATASETPIMAMINIDDDASQQRFADIMNALAAAGIENITIAQSPTP
jgi:biopolymer transport protein ExbD